jgi:hypothetical protein
MLRIAKYSFGAGDRFGRQGRAQVRAFQAMKDAGVAVTPVWNKSFREHGIIGSSPADTRRAADAAVAAEGWRDGYHVDADHIGLENVEPFLEACDFFTLDVAGFIGCPAEAPAVEDFVRRHAALTGRLSVEGLGRPLVLDKEALAAAARGYLNAIGAAGVLYRRIAARKGAGGFIAEVSMDEARAPQTPLELLVILAGLAEEGVPLQTIAPRFTGSFLKGVDYVGDADRFAREFEDDVCVLRHAVVRFGLPATLKLSVHSGSDKFSLYPPIAGVLARHDAGLHLKTAGTTWLEELAGLAAAGGGGLALAKDIYAGARPRLRELCAPYATVVAIREERLPSPAEVAGWTAEQFVRALAHNPADAAFNADFRQLLHVGFRVAAEMGRRYTDALGEHAAVIGPRVTANLLERHLRPLFPAGCRHA